MKVRISIIFIAVMLSYGALILNIYNLQVERGEYYSARAQSQYRSAGFFAAKRGNLFFSDKNGNKIPAAINKKYPTIFAVPKEVKDIEFTAGKLNELLNLDLENVRRQLSKINDLYELLIPKALSEQVAIIQQAALLGIYIDHQEARFYPFGDLAAQVLGFVGLSNRDDSLRGRYGAELNFEDQLAGTPGRLDGEKIIDPRHGEDLTLTIDRNIQARAEEVLSGVIQKHGATGGTVIVQEPATGRILALGNYPAFDPNNYFESPVKNYLNPAVQSLYEPGSVFKVITMAIGLDIGAITPETTYRDTGSVTFNGKTIKNWDLEKHGPYGTVTMRQVIERSINTGAVFAQRKTGQDVFYNYLLKFGFAEPTKISLPGEISGNIKNLKNSFQDINFATASFGQGVSVTPIGLISAISVIANDGVLMKPIVVDQEPSTAVRRVIGEKAAREVAAMMVSAVKKAEIGHIPNYKIAGKTGTAQVPDLKNGGYTNQFIHSFVGFAPASDPRIAILIKVDKPNAPLAGATVVPAFRELMAFVLNYYNVPPDDLDEKGESRN